MDTTVKNKTKQYEIFSLISYKDAIELFKQIQEKGAVIFGAAGEMGSKISSTFPKATIPIIMQDIDELKLHESKTAALESLEKAAKKRKLSKKQLEVIKEKKLIGYLIVFPEKGKIPFQEIDQASLESKEKGETLVNDFLNKAITNDKIRKQYQDSFMVLEAGPEVLSFKQNVFNFFELSLNSDKAILATNTSSLCVSDIANKLTHPERLIGFHYFLPAHVNPLIEIIAGEKTPPQVIQTMHNLAISMGKKPIICWKDSKGAIANRILIGVLNEAAKIYETCSLPPKVIDNIFLETFYSKQIKLQTRKAKNQFKAAPKLSFFMDDTHLYNEIKKIDEQLTRLTNNNKADNTELVKFLQIKQEKIEVLEGHLRQKLLYVQIVRNLESLGAFFKVSEIIVNLKTILEEQISKIRSCLSEAALNPDILRKPFTIAPYAFPLPENLSWTYKISKEVIKDRLIGAYITISQEIFKEGLGTVSDIELACKEGFKWNLGPFETIRKLGKERVEYLTNLTNATVNQDIKTGISKAGEIIPLNEFDLSGIQTYIQDNIGFVVLGRLHIQNLQMVQNSLSPEMLEAISSAIKELQTKKVKSIIFRSQGGGPFSSGADLDYIESTNWDTNKIIDYINLGKKVMNEIASCSIPTVAIIDGPAVGGGLELALACDYRVMTDLSYACLPEVALGIIPDWGGTERLPAIIGKELAKGLICTATLKNHGLKLSAEDAYELGLADAFILQSELPVFTADLIEGKKQKINIFAKSKKKENHNKKDYPENIIKRFKLDKPFKHSFRFFTKYSALLAEDLINHSDSPDYAKEVNDDKAGKKLLLCGKNVATWQIKPFINVAQNKLLAPLFEKFGLL